MSVASRLCRLSVFGSVLCVSLSGCGGSAKKFSTIPAKGVVTLDNQPVKNARVRFIPDSADEGRAAIGDTDANGEFSLSTVQPNDGIVPGSYKVNVISLETVTAESKDKGQFQAASDIPAKYNDEKTSGIRFTVEAGDANKSLEIKLSKK